MLQTDGAAVFGGDGCGDPQAEPGAAASGGKRRPATHLIDGGRALSGREAAAVVLDADQASTAVQTGGNCDAALCLPQRVVDEVVEQASEQHRVAGELRAGFAVHLEGHFRALRRAAPALVELFHDVVKRQGHLPYVERAGVAPRQEQQAVGQNGEPGRLVAWSRICSRLATYLAGVRLRWRVTSAVLRIALRGERNSWAASAVKRVRPSISASRSVAALTRALTVTVPMTVTTATAMNWKSAVRAGHWPISRSTTG